MVGWRRIVVIILMCRRSGPSNPWKVQYSRSPACILVLLLLVAVMKQLPTNCPVSDVYCALVTALAVTNSDDNSNMMCR